MCALESLCNVQFIYFYIISIQAGKITSKMEVLIMFYIVITYLLWDPSCTWEKLSNSMGVTSLKLHFVEKILAKFTSYPILLVLIGYYRDLFGWPVWWRRTRTESFNWMISVSREKWRGGWVRHTFIFVSRSPLVLESVSTVQPFPVWKSMLFTAWLPKARGSLDVQTRVYRFDFF